MRTGRGSFSATRTRPRPSSDADERSAAIGRPARSSTAARGPRSADTGISLPTRADRVATVDRSDPEAVWSAVAEVKNGHVLRVGLADFAGALDPLAQRSWWVRELLLSETVWDESECISSHECRLARQEIVQELAFSQDGTFHSTDPLARTVQLVKSVIECIGIDLCSMCREEYEAQEDASRRLVWKDLGKMFGFPDWVGL